MYFLKTCPTWEQGTISSVPPHIQTLKSKGNKKEDETMTHYRNRWKKILILLIAPIKIMKELQPKLLPLLFTKCFFLIIFFSHAFFQHTSWFWVKVFNSHCYSLPATWYVVIGCQWCTHFEILIALSVTSLHASCETVASDFVCPYFSYLHYLETR